VIAGWWLLACLGTPAGHVALDSGATPPSTDTAPDTDPAPDTAGTDSSPPTDSDPTTDSDTTPVDPACEDVPVVTWESWGQGFLVEACQGCHASTARDRYGAPASVVFDTEADAYRWKDRILSRAAAETPSMPPAGGVSEAERELLTIWLTCWIDQEV